MHPAENFPNILKVMWQSEKRKPARSFFFPTEDNGLERWTHALLKPQAHPNPSD